MIGAQYILDLNHELIVDNFAGGGGASTGIELAVGRHVDIAINHDPEAIAMHEANHPQTQHYCESVWDVNPREVTQGRPVGLAWFSPDCKHFSKAKGGKPVEKKIRGLAWVTLRWAATVKPRVIMLENVEEFVTWGPLVKDADGNMRPCPKRKGRDFKAFVNALRRHGYVVEHRQLRACDYGAPTIRKRLFLIARCDGRPIVWPAPTHGKNLQPYRTAAECIDWGNPTQSIFERSRPLAENTLKRIAVGIKRYVLEADRPFIIKVNHSYDQFRAQKINESLQTITSKHGFGIVVPTLAEIGYGERKGQAPRAHSLEKPLGTVVGTKKHAVVTPYLIGAGGPEYQGKPVAVDRPFGTLTTESHRQLVSAFIIKHYGEQFSGRKSVSAEEPLPTTTASGTQTQVMTAQLVGCGGRAGQSRPRDAGEPMATLTAKADTVIATSHLLKMRNNQFGQAIEEPLPTLTAGGGHVGEVRAFLVKYYGTAVGQDLTDPLHTVTTKQRMGLVTIAGEEYQIADIGMRMLTPRELYRAQGFPESYIIDPIINGKPLTKTAQVRMCGNSVCPPIATALVRANLSDIAIRKVA